MESRKDIIQAIENSWQLIKIESLNVLGSELHYQAMIYHAFRCSGKVDLSQIGMNVKLWVTNPVSDFFKELESRKHVDFRGGAEVIPDVVLFSKKINGDWRRRNEMNTLLNMYSVIEVKASERHKNRLKEKEICNDLKKMDALIKEVKNLKSESIPIPIMMIIDSAPEEKERMSFSDLNKVRELSKELKIGLLYISNEIEINNLSEVLKV